MKLIQYRVGDDQKVVQFNGKTARVDKIWSAITQIREGLCDHTEHYMILSNSDRVLLYFNGNRNGRHFYIQGIMALSDQTYKQWNAVRRELKVDYLELITNSGNENNRVQFEEMGLTFVSKRVVFTVTDPEGVSFPTCGVQLQDNSSLEEIAALCELTKKTLAGAEDILASAAVGSTSVQMRFTDSVLTSAMFYSEVGSEMLASEAFVSVYPTGSTEYTNEFIEHFYGMLGRCAKENKQYSIAIAAQASIPEHEGVVHVVQTHHYTTV